MRAVREFLDTLPERPWIVIVASLVLLGAWAAADAATVPLARHSFYFENIHGLGIVHELRDLPREKDREGQIARYVSEYLLGSALLEAEALFPEGTAVRLLMLRGRRVIIDLDGRAAVPVSEQTSVASSLALLEKGIKRNFSFVEDVSLTIAGTIPQFRNPEGMQQGSRSQK